MYRKGWKNLNNVPGRPHSRHTALIVAFGVVWAVGVPDVASGQTRTTPVKFERIDVRSAFTVSYPDTWSVRQVGNIQQIIAASPDAISRGEVDFENVAMIGVHTEQRTDHGDALLRLKQIEAESNTASRFVEIAGWPALQREHLVPRPMAGKPSDRHPDRLLQLVVTTAIAVDDLIVRLEATLPSDAAAEAIQDVLAVGESVVPRRAGDSDSAKNTAERLSQEPKIRALEAERLPDNSIVTVENPALEPIAATIAGTPLRVTNQAGIDAELEIAVSTDGANIVIGSNGNYFFSTDGGQTFNTSAGINGNDPSLGFGVSGTFYAANIGNACNTAILTSTNNGQTFTATNSAYTCPAADCAANGGPVCAAGFPDQEHIAVDRYNPGPGGDQLYSSWRSLWLGVGPGIVGSQDGGTNWTAACFIGPGDFPRITVGQDGAIYVVYRNGNNIELRRFANFAAVNACAPPAPAVVVTTNPQVPCPVPGLNRCNDGNNLSSPTVAVDDTNANHVFVSYAANTSPTNENVMLQDSIDAGNNWGSCRAICGTPLPGDSLFPCTPGGAPCPVIGEVCCPNTVQLSSGIQGRRFMPWVCSVGGEAFVTWFDRRNATAADNSLTDFFGASAKREGFALTAGDEIKFTPVSDSHCGPANTAWPGTAPRSANDSESCTQQPQLAGQCSVSGVRCDFSDCGGAGSNTGPPCQCAAGNVCNIAGGSPPKHGDYNGNACIAGRLYSTWVSSTSPPSITPASTSIDIFFNSMIVCCVPQIQVPGDLEFGDVCVGESATKTLNVCNTGAENLIVDAITSSDPDVTVSNPAAGYPVVISPDFCFPFEVNVSPAAGGAIAATLTIPSNDTVNPNLEVGVSANGAERRIVTAIADSGNFGNVCLGDYKDLDLTISNSGNCPLSITNITSSDPTEFKVPSVIVYPIVVGPKDSVHIPIRFEPTSLTPPPKNETITIHSNDPANGEVDIAVSGTVPPGDIRVSGSTDFGIVCAEDLDSAEKDVSICNVGLCTLNVTSVAFDPPCADFTLINNPFPAPVSHDFCMDVTIRFTPTSAGPKSCTLRIESDDPDTPVVELTVTGEVPFASIDVPPDVGFPATVVQAVAACESAESFPVSNTGVCNLNITNYEISLNPVDFGIDGLPSFPIILEPGHIAGEGDLTLTFAPVILEPDPLDRDHLGEVSVTYVSDPVTGDTTTVTRSLCGESVRTGARVLVTYNGVPVDEVFQMKILRINANRNKSRLDTVDQSKDLPLVDVTPTAPCASFQYHREYGAVSNPIQLLPGSYEVAAVIRVDGRIHRKIVGFKVGSCGFNANVIVDFP